MHEVKAFIRPELLDRVIRELHAIADLPGVTTSAVQGHGKRLGRDMSTEFGEVPMVEVEMVVPDVLLQSVVEAIQRSASTGRSGDGKIFVMPVESATRIRSGEVGPEAL